MHVEELEKALTFFNDILGFETQFRARDYAYIHRQTAGIRILEQRVLMPRRQVRDASLTILMFATSTSSTRN
jgi:catechol-2,3-dioxygenase